MQFILVDAGACLVDAGRAGFEQRGGGRFGIRFGARFACEQLGHPDGDLLLQPEPVRGRVAERR